MSSLASDPTQAGESLMGHHREGYERQLPQLPTASQSKSSRLAEAIYSSSPTLRSTDAPSRSHHASPSSPASNAASPSSRSSPRSRSGDAVHASTSASTSSFRTHDTASQERPQRRIPPVRRPSEQPIDRDSQWDEQEFQRMAADRNSKVSLASQYDGDDGMEEDAGEGRRDAVSSFGHASKASTGSSTVYAGRGAGPSVSRSEVKTPGQSRPLPTSSIPLQQLRTQDKSSGFSSTFNNESSSSAQSSLAPGGGLLPPSYRSPNPGSDEEAFRNAKSRDVTPSASTDGQSYPPLPPVPEKGFVPPRSGSFAKRKPRGLVLSFDGALADEERKIRSSSPPLNDRDEAVTGIHLASGSDPSDGSLGISSLGPRLRKHEPAPWEMNGEEELSENASITSSMLNPPTSPRASPWTKLTRGSVDVREKEANEQRRVLGLVGNFRRPSMDTNRRPSVDHVSRDSPLNAISSPRSKSRLRTPQGNISGPLSPGRLASREETTTHDQTSSSNHSLGGKSPRFPSSPFAGDEGVAVSPSESTAKTRSRSKSVTRTMLKGLGLGGAHSTDRPDLPSTSNRLVKSWKRKGDKVDEELSLSKGVSSEDYRTDKEPQQPNNLATRTDPVVLVTSSSNEELARLAQGQQQPPTNVRAVMDANKGLTNPFATRTLTSSTTPSSSSRSVSSRIEYDAELAPDESPRTPVISVSNSFSPSSSLKSLPRTPQKKPTSPPTSPSKHRQKQLAHSAKSSVDANANTSQREPAQEAESVSSHQASGGHQSIPSAGSVSATVAQARPEVSEPLIKPSPGGPQRQLALSPSAMMSPPLSPPMPSTILSPTSPGRTRGMGLGYRSASNFANTPASPPLRQTSFDTSSAVFKSAAGSPLTVPSRTRSETAPGAILPFTAASPAQSALRQRTEELIQEEARAAVAINRGSGVSPSDSSSSRRPHDSPTSDGDLSMTETTQDTTISSTLDADTPPVKPTQYPTPGAHEAVGYKLVSLEQARAMQMAKLQEDAAKRREAQGSSSSDTAQNDLAGSSDQGRLLRNKKSGLLKLFNRGQGGSDPDSHPLPSGDGQAHTTRLGTPTLSFTNSDSASDLGQRGESKGSAAAPALGVLRPVSSMFASLSPNLVDTDDESFADVSTSSGSVFALLQNQSRPSGYAQRGSDDSSSASFNASPLGSHPTSVIYEDARSQLGADAAAMSSYSGSTSAEGSAPGSLRPSFTSPRQQQQQQPRKNHLDVRPSSSSLASSVSSSGALPASAPRRPSTSGATMSIQPSSYQVREATEVLRSPGEDSNAAEDGEFYSPQGSPMGGEFADHTSPNTTLKSPAAALRVAQLAEKTGGPSKPRLQRNSSSSSKPGPESSLRLANITQAASSPLSETSFAQRSPSSTRQRVRELEDQLSKLVAELIDLRSANTSTLGLTTTPTMPGNARLLAAPPSPGTPSGSVGPAYPSLDKIDTSSRSPTASVMSPVSTLVTSPSSPSLAASADGPRARQPSPKGSEIPSCAACGCDCSESKRLQAVKELTSLYKTLPPASPVGGSSDDSSSVMDRGRGVKRSVEDHLGRFGG